jgi:hypothetical protein
MILPVTLAKSMCLFSGHLASPTSQPVRPAGCSQPVLPALVREVGYQGLCDGIDDANVPLRDSPPPDGRAEEQVALCRRPETGIARALPKILVSDPVVFPPQRDPRGVDQVQPQGTPQCKGRGGGHDDDDDEEEEDGNVRGFARLRVLPFFRSSDLLLVVVGRSFFRRSLPRTLGVMLTMLTIP